MAFDIRSLGRASFNGIPFHVDNSEIEAGHRVSTTTVPNGTHINESFGPAARKFEVEAYLTGATSLALAEALRTAAEQQHLGVLSLPDRPASYVRLTKAKSKFEKDKLGYITVSLEAVAEPTTAGSRLSANALEAQIYGLTASVAVAIGAYAAASLRLSGQAATVQEAGFESGADALGDLVALSSQLRLDPAGLDALAPLVSAATTALADIVADPAAFGLALANVAIGIGDVADPVVLAQTLDQLGPPADASAPAVSQGTALVIAANATVAVALQAATRALALGEAMARRSYRDRPEAVAARGLAISVFDDALARIGRGGLDLLDQLSAMSGVVAELVQRRESDLAPLITVSANRPLPALVYAWALYADPARAPEIAQRAGADHQGFMPERFDALAA